MIVKISSKEYSFDGYVNPLNSVQKLAEEVYQQGAKDFARWLVEDSNICDVTYCDYVDVDSVDYSINQVIEIWKEQLKEQKNE